MNDTTYLLNLSRCGQGVVCAELRDPDTGTEIAAAVGDTPQAAFAALAATAALPGAAAN